MRITDEHSRTMTSTDRRAEIVRKIQALRRVAEGTQFLGQKEAALAAIDRLLRKYQIDVEELRDDEKKGRVISAPAGWRRKMAIHLGFYLGLAPCRTWILRKGEFIINATDAEFELFKATLEFHLQNCMVYEGRLAAELDVLRAVLKDAKRGLAKGKRDKLAKMKWFQQGYIGAVMPIDLKGKKCRLTPEEWMAHDAGTEAGRRAQIEKGVPALSGSDE